MTGVQTCALPILNAFYNMLNDPVTMSSDNCPDFCISGKTFCDEPTKGVDVGAKAEIYAIMGDLAKKGYAIILISSEMPEILGMADRIVVMCNGRKTGELNRGEATQERILELAMEKGHTGGAK